MNKNTNTNAARTSQQSEASAQAGQNQAAEQVLAWIDSHREEIVSYLQEMIRIPSVNPWFLDEPGPSKEADVQQFLAGHLRSLGAKVDIWEPKADDLAIYEGRAGYYAGRDFTGRPNLAATFSGTGGGRSLLLFGHVDVVLAGTKWTKDPFGGEVEDGLIYGRGSVDMKGGMTAMIKALEAIIRSGISLPGDVIVGSVVDEEAGGMGTLDFVHQGYRADGCILTESTGLTIGPLCRGILWGKLTIHGRSGHIEMPQGDWRTGGAVDAIDKATVYLEEFKRLNEEWSYYKKHPLLPLPCEVLVAQVEAGEYPTSFANRAEITFNAQYLPSERDELKMGGRVKQELEAFIQAVAETDPWLKEHPPEIEWLIDADCAETDAEHPFVQTCAQSLSKLGKPQTVQGLTSHTDMGWLVNVGIPTVNFGPGEPRLAHHSDEHIPIDDLIDATKMIALTILDWCGSDVQERSEDQ